MVGTVIAATSVGALVASALTLIALRSYNEGVVGHAGLVAIIIGGSGYLYTLDEGVFGGRAIVIVLAGMSLFMLRHLYRVVTRGRR